MRDYKEFTLLNAAPVRAITSSTDATPIVVTTAAAHGLSTGDLITIYGHGTNVNANGTFKVTVTDTDKFSLQDPDTGANIAGSGAGAGSGGVWAPRAKVILIDDFSHAILSFDTDGGGDAAMTVKLAGSIQSDAPDFADAQAVDNQYDYLDMIDQEDGASVDGDTGFVVATADDHRQFEANINAMRWLTVVPVAGTAGEITVKLRVYTKGT